MKYVVLFILIWLGNQPIIQTQEFNDLDSCMVAEREIRAYYTMTGPFGNKPALVTWCQMK